MKPMRKYGGTDIFNTMTDRAIDTFQSFSTNQKYDVVLSGISAIRDLYGNYCNLQQERERTKQIELESQVRIQESNNELEKKFYEFKYQMECLYKKHEVEMKNLDNQYIVRMRELELLEKMIDKIDILENEIQNSKNSDKDMLSNHIVRHFENLHQQKLSIINALISIGKE